MNICTLFRSRITMKGTWGILMKIKSFLETFAGAILGILLLFFGVQFFGVGNPGLVASGAISFSFGVLYLAGAIIITLLLGTKLSILKPFVFIYNVIAWPLLMFVQHLVTMINLGAQNLTATDWIIYLSLFLAIFLIVTMTILHAVLPSKIVGKIRNIGFIVFFALLVLTIVFPLGFGLTTLGLITLYELITLACYVSIAANYLNASAKKEDASEEAPKEEPVEEEPVEEAPKAEEPKEEAPAEEEPVEEPAE